MTMTRIVPATVDDLDAIAAIEVHSFPKAWPRATFEAELANPNAHVDVARADHAPSVIIGYHNYWIVAHELHVLTIATHPDHRRAGIGRALLDHAIEKARARDCMLATLEVRAGNAPAIALYQRTGFRVTHVRSRYYSDNDEDALVMLKALSAE